MNPALLFLVVIAGITAVVLWVVLRPLLARSREQGVHANVVDPRGHGQTNVEALRVELTEARRDRALGLLTDTALLEAERELEARVLTESAIDAPPAAPRYKRTAISLGVLLPVLAVAGYAAVGSPVALVPEAVRPTASAASAATGTNAASQSAADQQMEELFRLAEERLAKEPNDVKGWALLARAKASVGMFEGAIAAYDKAVALDARDSDLWSDYADAAAGLAQGNMAGKPIDLVTRSLALDGKNPKALLLRGTWEMQQNDLAAAEKSFTLARSVVAANTGFAQIADNALADIKTRRGGTAAPTTANAASGTAPAPAAGAADTPLATVRLSLAADARKSLPASAAIFVIVRAAGADRGPPLAAKKIALADLDRPVQLSAADGMIGGAGLKPGADVVLQARLSLAGQPIAQTGDWQSSRVNAKLPVTSLTLAIDELLKN